MKRAYKRREGMKNMKRYTQADFDALVRDVHGGTQHETDYLAFAEFARARFARYKTEQP